MFRWFVNLNKKICYKIDMHLAYRTPLIIEQYINRISEHLNQKPDALVVDVGAGIECPFAKLRDPQLRIRIVGVDILPAALEQNHDIDDKVVADVNNEFPFADNSVDLITSRMVLEHLQNNARFFQRAFASLKPGGYFIHVCPAKYALFSMINQMLPKKFGRKLLFFIFPERVNSGFPAYYDQCSYYRMSKLLKKQGFVIDGFDFSYYQSSYFSFFVPFYLISVLYELFSYKLGLRNLSSFLLFV
ncbi:MAG: methyltransferase domain-containing protein, partial [bacterium]|nr:methyltransferase domain-containing protein [bacterium]